jgi:hypothetical protein
MENVEEQPRQAIVLVASEENPLEGLYDDLPDLP